MKNQDSSQEAIIKIIEVRKSFGENEVLKGVSLQVHSGETLTILGESGCGKSVLMSMLVGLLTADRGKIIIQGQDVTEFESEAEWDSIRLKIGFLFQGSALYDSMSVGENIAFPLHQHTKLSEEEIRQKVAEKLQMVNLAGIEEKMPAEISGGMQKRVALARAIILDPAIIFYDEPTTGLDPIRSRTISELIRHLQQELKVTSVVVTHDMTCAYTVSDKIALLRKGEIIVEGSPEEIRESNNSYLQEFISSQNY